MTLARKVLVTSSAGLVLLVLVGTIAARVDDSAGATVEDLKVFSETLVLVNRNYVEKVDANQLERGAFQGLAESLDPWSSYYDPASARRLLERDRSGDVGLLLLKQPQQYVRVVVVVPGGPADRAGLERGEFLKTIDGVETRELTLLEAALMLAGPPGTTVSLGFMPEEEDAEGRVVALAREDMGPLRVVSETVEPGVALLRVTDVRAGVADLVRERLAALEKAGHSSLVLDLRANTGGSLDEAAAVADLFVGAEPLFQRKAKGDESVFEGRVGTAWAGGLVALVGRATVGEAEVLAHALRSAGHSVLVGQPTFGKYSQQDLVLLDDGSGLYMSVAEYRKADGTAFDDGGVQPDEVVAAAAAKSEDGDFSAASEAASGEDAIDEPDETPADREGRADPLPARRREKEPAAPEAAPAPAAPVPVPEAPGRTGPADAPDPQLRRAIEILKGAQVKKAA